MKLTDNQRQILLKFVQEKHLTEKDFLHIENVSDEEGRWIISQAIMNYKKGVKVVGSVKQFNDFKEFISACSDYNDKAWEYAMCLKKDKELGKWLDSFEKDED